MAEVTGLPAALGASAPGSGPAVSGDLPEAPRRKVLLFRVAGEWFAITLDGVREICSRTAITRVPRAPAPVIGVMNLRGRAVILLDLPRCLGLPAGGGGAPHVVLLDLGDPDLAVGVLADRIDQVVEVELRGPAGALGPDGPGGAEGPQLVEVEGHVATLLDPMRVLAQALPGVAGGGAGETA